MPEGHTLRRLADDLSGVFGGRALAVSSPQGRFAEEAQLLDGTAFLGADSAGKHLFLDFEDERVVHIHLGLYGKFLVRSGEAPPAVGQVRLRLVAAGDDGRDPAYADLRGATQCALADQEHRTGVLGRLGPDPLRSGSDPAPAWQRISRSSRPIGELLMDQTVLSGIGNVYRAEILFRHRIHPLRPGRTLRRGQFLAMWQDLVELMPDGVRSNRIDTVRPEHLPPSKGRRGRGGDVYVYRRQGLPCLVCGTEVRTEVLAGRNSFWCPKCQPVFRSRARVRTAS
jgi:DNA-formamidopyrimidine glycosylase